MNIKIVLENLLVKREYVLNTDRLTDRIFTFQDTTKSDHDKIQILKALPSISLRRILKHLLFWHNVYVYPNHPDYQALKQATYLDEFRLLLQTKRNIDGIDLPTDFQKIKQEYEIVFHRLDLIYDMKEVVASYL